MFYQLHYYYKYNIKCLAGIWKTGNRAICVSKFARNGYLKEDSHIFFRKISEQQTKFGENSK